MRQSPMPGVRQYKAGRGVARHATVYELLDYRNRYSHVLALANRLQSCNRL